MLFKEVHPPKTVSPAPKDITDSGIAILFNAEQLANAPFSMVVTKLGMETLVKLVQPLKAEVLMLITVFGIA